MIKFKPNSIANNSLSRPAKKSAPFVSDGRIRELELTLTNKCNLTCFGCGFDVPNQIAATDDGAGIDQHLQALVRLREIGISVAKIVLVGGEAALVKDLDEQIFKMREIGICQEIELVTNGLYPRGVTTQVLSKIDSLVISDYICTAEFSDLWERYLNKNMFQGKVDFRRKDAWDDLLAEVENSSGMTEQHWDECFYRTYDVTLERGRLFSCSRIAKKKWDDQGLVIGSETSKQNVIDYLLSDLPKDACYSCATVCQSSNIPVAQQVSSDLHRIVEKAQTYLKKETMDEY